MLTLKGEISSVNLFSVSSSLRVLCASSSWAWSAAIFSLSYSSCCTLSILFSCCSLMNFSLNNHTYEVSVHTHTPTQHTGETQSEAEAVTCTQWELILLPGYHGWGCQKEASLHEKVYVKMTRWYVAKQSHCCQISLATLSSEVPAWESWCCWAWVHRSSSLISFKDSLSMMIL